MKHKLKGGADMPGTQMGIARNLVGTAPSPTYCQHRKSSAAMLAHFCIIASLESRMGLKAQIRSRKKSDEPQFWHDGGFMGQDLASK